MYIVCVSILPLFHFTNVNLSCMFSSFFLFLLYALHNNTHLFITFSFSFILLFFLSNHYNCVYWPVFVNRELWFPFRFRPFIMVYYLSLHLMANISRKGYKVVMNTSLFVKVTAYLFTHNLITESISLCKDICMYIYFLCSFLYEQTHNDLRFHQKCSKIDFCDLYDFLWRIFA